MTPILLLEINEVPWRLLDRYLQDEAYPNLRRFFGGAVSFTTLATDTGELSPWVTWPTLHRGMNNERHGVLNLGQDPSTFRGVPIWAEIRQRGGNVGVCGSMQSWPPVDPGPGGFYIPDTFAHDSQCIPARVEPFQAFNLGQVGRNARVVDKQVPKPIEALRVVSSALRSGVRLGTLARTVSQIVAERFDGDRAKRRPVFQTILFWDVFRDLFRAGPPPAFSTFFTNHVAGVMHRYWHDVFPEDFEDAEGRRGPPPSGQEPLMRFALQVLDEMLAEVIAWTEAHPDLVVVYASSMGQHAVRNEAHEGVELIVDDLARLMKAAGVDAGQFSPLLAMVPQVAVDIPDAGLRATARDLLEGATTLDGHRFITVQELGTSLSITVGTPRRAAIDLGACRIGGRQAAWQELGVRPQEVEAGSAYHIPEGSFAFFGQKVKAGDAPARALVRADQIKDWLLRISADGPAEVQRPPVPETARERELEGA